MKIKSQIARELLRKRYFFNKVNKPLTCHNPQKAWTPLRVFRSNGFIREILFQLISIFCLHSSVVVLVAIEIFSWTWNVLQKRKVLGLKLKQKREPKRRKVANLGMKRRTFLRTVTRAKRNLAMNIVVLHPKVLWESVEKKWWERTCQKKEMLSESHFQAQARIILPQRFHVIHECLLAIVRGTCSSISLFFLEDCFVFVFPIDDYLPKACVQKTWPKL